MPPDYVPLTHIPSDPSPPSAIVPPATPRARRRVWPKILSTIIILLIIAGGGALGYGYWKKIGPFSQPPYDPEHLLNGVIDGFNKIQSANYSLTLEIKPQAREADAAPFIFTAPATSERTLKLKRDEDRFRDLREIGKKLDDYYFKKKIYPADLMGLEFTQQEPLGAPYNYQATEKNKNYELAITFETPAAIETIRRLGGLRLETATSTIKITGQTASFNRLNNHFFYFKSEDHEPFLVKFAKNQGTYSSFIPADFQLQGEVAGTFNRQAADWQTNDAHFQLKGGLESDDLTSNVDFEFTKKAQDFYFRINRFPTIFFFDLTSIKGTWVKVTINDLMSSTSRTSFLSSVPEVTEKIKRNQEKFSRDLTRVLAIADEEKVVVANVTPKKEKLGEIAAYRYDLALNQNQLVHFYERLLTEFKTLDHATLEYMKGPDFKQVFDYLAKNNHFSIWVDAASGLPAQMTYYLRLVPDAQVQQLKDKQINVTWRLSLTELNQPIIVTAPTSYQTLTEILNSYRATSTESL